MNQTRVLLTLLATGAVISVVCAWLRVVTVIAGWTAHARMEAGR